MSALQSLDHYINSLLAATIVVIVVFSGLAYYFVKVKKMTAKEEHPNYDRFERRDALEYVKFDNTLSEYRITEEKTEKDAGMGMFKINKNVFVGGLNITGYNFHSASLEERKRTMINSIAFTNIIKHPIQMRQSVKSVDVTYNIEVYRNKAKEWEKRLIDLDEDYQKVYELMGEYLEEPEQYYLLESRLESIRRERVSAKWIFDECLTAIHYLEVVMEAGSNAKKTNQIMFSYVHNPNEYVQELSEEEIILKGFNELSIRGDSYASALTNCGCTVSTFKRDELVNLARKHFHPDSAEKVRLDEILNSTYFESFITCDDIKELELERIGEEMYEQEMQQLEKEYMEGMEEAENDFRNEQEAMELLTQQIAVKAQMV